MHPKHAVSSLLTLFAINAAAPALAQNPPCVVPIVGGTATLPPPGCGYLSPMDVHMIIAGLPPGTTLRLGAEHRFFFNIMELCPGGALGGCEERFGSNAGLDIDGTGNLAGFHRNVTLQLQCTAHSGPRNPGQPVQSFDTDMFAMMGQITGDPDFDLLRITGGSGFGLPSPGHTTLTLQPSGTVHVDSFFDIFYRIDFVGAPGGALAGMSGSTTATIRMECGANEMGTNYCMANPNSTGSPGQISALGSPIAAANNLTLRATQLPSFQSGYFLTSMNAGFIANPGGSQGNLCLGSGIGRFAAQVMNSGPMGVIQVPINLASIPTNPPQPVMAGQTWRYTCWFRDFNPFPTSNFTNGVSVSYI